MNSLCALTQEETAFVLQFPSATLLDAARDIPDVEPIQVAFLGRNFATGRGPTNVLGNFPEIVGTNRFRIISFYTEGNEYEDHAMRFVETLEQFELPHKIVPISDRGSWELNCAYKAKFVFDEWKNSPDPVVWIDVDATVEADPILFKCLQADFAIHKNAWSVEERRLGWEFCSGTLYFGKSDRTQRLLEQWILRSEADPETWDQVHLHSAWCDVNAISPLQTAWLPRPYLQINGGWEAEPAVIRHWQASRKKNDQKLSYFVLNESGKKVRQHNQIWRTPEEAFWIEEGPAHIKPETGQSFPEGFDVERALREAIDGRFPLLEVGCGVGRIASLFKPGEYLGVDVSPKAVSIARKNLCSHSFKLIDFGYRLPACRSVLFYTVLLHIDDEQVGIEMQRAAEVGARVLIAEIMDRRWRRSGNPPVYNRDPEEYIAKMEAVGFRLASYQKRDYERYARDQSGSARDTRMTILAFDPKE